MATAVETAKDLLQLAAGPSILGVGALITYATATYSDPKRVPSKGWLALGAGVLLFGWLLLFVLLALPTVWQSWATDGTVEPVLVLLTAAWLVAIALLALVVWKVPTAVTYLTASYRPDEMPWLLRLIRRRRG